MINVRNVEFYLAIVVSMILTLPVFANAGKPPAAPKAVRFKVCFEVEPGNRGVLVGPSFLRAGQVGQFTAVDLEGDVPFRSEKSESPRGDWTVASENNLHYDNPFIFIEDPDENLFTIAIRFDAPGEYVVRTKLTGASITVKVVE